MVVGGETGVSQAVGLVLVQHAERHTGLHAQSPRTPRTISSTWSNSAPSRTSRQAAPMQNRDAHLRLLRFLRFLKHCIDIEQRVRAQLPGFLRVMGRLGAVFAVLRAGAGLDRQKTGQLHRSFFVDYRRWTALRVGTKAQSGAHAGFRAPHPTLQSWRSAALLPFASARMLFALSCVSAMSLILMPICCRTGAPVIQDDEWERKPLSGLACGTQARRTAPLAPFAQP